MTGESFHNEVNENKSFLSESFRDIKPENKMSPKEMFNAVREEFSKASQEYDSLSSHSFNDVLDDRLINNQENNSINPDSFENDTNSRISNDLKDIYDSDNQSSKSVDMEKLSIDGNKYLDNLTVEQKQELADKSAQEYNEKYKPYERAIDKGIDGVTKTENGGVSFADSEHIFKDENGEKYVVNIKATGNRLDDFDAANEAKGLDETPDGYVWHHLDDYNVKDGTVTLELVTDEAHNASKPHSGGCAQFDAVNGPSYNPERKGA